MIICCAGNFYTSTWILDKGDMGKTIMFNNDGKFVSPFESGGWKFTNEQTDIIRFDSDAPSDIYVHVNNFHKRKCTNPIRGSKF